MLLEMAGTGVGERFGRRFSSTATTHHHSADGRQAHISTATLAYCCDSEGVFTTGVAATIFSAAANFRQNLN